MSEEGAIHIDLTGVSVGFEPVEPGYYGAVIYSVTSKTSKRSGQPMLEFLFNITEPASAAGRRLFANYSLQKQALWKLKGTLEALDTGMDLEGPIDVVPGDLVGLPCVLAIELDETPDGTPVNRVTRVMPAGSFVPMGPGEVEEDLGLDFEL